MIYKITINCVNDMSEYVFEMNASSISRLKEQLKNDNRISLSYKNVEYIFIVNNIELITISEIED